MRRTAEFVSYEPRFNKAAIKDALQEGREVPGAILESSTRLDIRSVGRTQSVQVSETEEQMEGIAIDSGTMWLDPIPHGLRERACQALQSGDVVGFRGYASKDPGLPVLHETRGLLKDGDL